MGFAVTEVCEKVRQGNSDLHKKKRVWGNFSNPNKMRPANRRQPLKTQVGKTTYAYKIASGRPLYRYYDPVTGRWPSRDPLADEAFFKDFVKGKSRNDRLKLRNESLGNIYGFVANDGINKKDYLGLADKCCPKPELDEWSKNIYTAVSAGLAIYGKGLPPNPYEWGDLFKDTASIMTAGRLRTACINCYGKVLCMQPSADRKKVRELCAKICAMAQYMAKQALK